MACQEVQFWSLSGLVSAFFDLAIAYLLLCGSAVVYFASKLLSFFGLNLPRLCDGILFNSNRFFLKRLLVDFPIQKVKHVLLSVEHNSPFLSSTTKNRNSCTIGDNAIHEVQGEASCSSVPDRRKSADVVGMRNRGKGCKNSVVMAYDLPEHEEDHFSINREGNGLSGESSIVVDTDATGVQFLQCGTNHSQGEDILLNRNSLSDLELQNGEQGIQSFNGDEKTALRLLQEKLEEERAARAALQVELDEERSAAAGAADEAMAMILRLQEEKASLEMESRQYERMLDEKSNYDAEEMSILKEILFRREKEKHFLEKEVENYMQMVSMGNEELEGEDFRLLELSGKQFPEGIVSMDKSTDKLAFENEPLSKSQDERFFIKQKVDSDEQYVGVGNTEDKNQLTSKAPHLCTGRGPVEELEQIQELNSDHELAENVILTCNGTETSYPSNMKQHTKDKNRGSSNSCDPMLEKDCERNSVPFEAAATNPSSSGMNPENDIRTSISEGLPPIGRRSLPAVLSGLRQGSPGLSGWRRGSMSPLDSEMQKINSEVGLLQERLKLVQEEREKLSVSVQNRDTGNIQLKLLEDISNHVQEIRHLTQPGKVTRQVSLPIPPLKVSSNQRRSRSVSAAHEISSEDNP